MRLGPRTRNRVRVRFRGLGIGLRLGFGSGLGLGLGFMLRSELSVVTTIAVYRMLVLGLRSRLGFRARNRVRVSGFSSFL